MYLHLDRLKARILPPELAAGTGGDRLDARLGPIAEGLCDLFDSHCGRTFARGEDVEEAFAGGQGHLKLSRYPVESVEGVLMVSPDGIETDIMDTVARVSKAAGLVHFIFPPGSEDDEIVVTYTGGYYIDESEGGDGDPPEGAATLPRDLVDAWVLQCDHEARARKLLGNAPQSGTSQKDVAAHLPKDYDLIPRVERALRAHARIC